MTKSTHRLILTAYLACEVLLALVCSMTTVPLPRDVLVELFHLYGTPTAVPSALQTGLGVASSLLFLYAIIGLYLFWPRARLVFTLVLLGFAAVEPLKPFYLYSGWHQCAMHLRLMLHGFIIGMIYLGPSRVYFSRGPAT
ncbi:MAG: hypothetical protein ACO1TE_02290 [Prosthecobacter sp.]